MKRNGGFTLIELLVVIAIIGILASVILASLTSGRAKANDTNRKATIHQLQTALEEYYSDNGAYPTTTAYSPWNTKTWALGTGATTFYDALVPKYLPSLPLDPTGSYESSPPNFLGDGYPADKGYYYTSDGNTYTLGTNLQNPTNPNNYAGNYVVTSN
ncbi:MAG: type II secretion system protein [Patescibacteria group bacterium]